MFKLENNKSNDTADIKVLLNSGTGSGKSNMLMWAAKALYIQEQEPTLSVKQLYKKVFSSVQSGQINANRTLTIATTAIPDVLLEIQKTIETHVDFSISESLDALNVLANEDDLGFIKVVNGLSRISSNEILTPVEPINVPELVVSKINFSNLDNVLNSPISVINNADKTAIFQIEVFNKIEKKLGKEAAEQAEYYSIPTSALSYEFIRAVYVKRGWNTDWVIWDKDNFENGALDCFKDNWAYVITLTILYLAETDERGKGRLQKNFDKLISSDDNSEKDISRMALVSFVKDRFMKDGELIKFDVVVSNPPYQDSNDNQIFNLFQETALIMSDQTSMVYPARWWYGTKSLNMFRNDLINSGRLKNVLFYSNNVPLFENVEIAGGISIIYCNDNIVKSFSLKEIETGIEVSVDCDSFLNELYPIRPAFFKIVNKLDNFKKLTKIDKDTKLGLTGDKLKNIVIEKVDKDKKVKNSQLKIYANISGDKGGRADYYLADKDKVIKNGGNVVKGYKVLMRQAIIENENRMFTTFIVDDNTVYGRAAVGLGIFDKELEAKNFLSYCNTAFFEFVLRSNIAGRSKAFLSFVPDLSTITNPRTGKVGWDSDWTDDDLKILFKDVLTDDDWKYIEKTAIESDPAGFKRAKAKRKS